MRFVEKVLGLGCEDDIVGLMRLVDVLASRDQIGHGVVVPDQLQLYRLLHVVYQLLQLRVAELVQVQAEGQLFVQILGKLS